MSQFMLLLRNEPSAFGGMSPEEMQRVFAKYRTWRTATAAKIVGGNKLTHGDGRVLRNGSLTDGPFAEAKEVMGGFFIVEAADYDEAVRIASDCPHMEYGSIEVREVDEMARR